MKLIFGVRIDEENVEEDVSHLVGQDDDTKNTIARQIVKDYIMNNADYWWRFEDEEE